MASAGARLKRRITDMYIYIMLIVFPLFTGFDGYRNITASKLYFFVAATLLWLAGMIAISIRYRHVDRRRLSAIEICVLAYFAVCCVSALISPFGNSVLLGAGRFDGLLNTALCVCIFMGVSRYATARVGYAYALAISAFLCCSVAVLQFMGLNPLHLFPGEYSYQDMGVLYSGEFLGTIGNANLFCAYLCLVIPLLTVIVICGTKRRLFLLPVIALCVFCLLKCTVSAGKLAMLAFVLVFLPFAAARFSHKSKRRTAVLIGCCASLLLATAAVLIINFKGEGLSGTINELYSVMHGDVRNSFGSSRIQIWRECLRLFHESPLLGGGPGTISLRLDIDFSRFVAETGKTLTSSVDNAHNAYLQILTDTGLLSLILYLAAMIITTLKAARTGLEKPLLLAIGGALLCYWVQDFFGLGLFLVAPVMWILWALAASHENRRKPRDQY